MRDRFASIGNHRPANHRPFAPIASPRTLPLDALPPPPHRHPHAPPRRLDARLRYGPAGRRRRSWRPPARQHRSPCRGSRRRLHQPARREGRRQGHARGRVEARRGQGGRVRARQGRDLPPRPRLERGGTRDDARRRRAHHGLRQQRAADGRPLRRRLRVAPRPPPQGRQHAALRSRGPWPPPRHAPPPAGRDHDLRPRSHLSRHPPGHVACARRRPRLQRGSVHPHPRPPHAGLRGGDVVRPLHARALLDRQTPPRRQPPRRRQARRPRLLHADRPRQRHAPDRTLVHPRPRRRRVDAQAHVRQPHRLERAVHVDRPAAQAHRVARPGPLAPRRKRRGHLAGRLVRAAARHRHRLPHQPPPLRL